jgi:D-alanyl-D-alanine dipeptidase
MCNFECMRLSILLVILGFMCSCSDIAVTKQQSPISVKDSSAFVVHSMEKQEPLSGDSSIITSEAESSFLKAGLQDVQLLDPSIRVNLKYASNDNFMGRNLYGNLRKAYLQPEVAAKVVRAQQLLKTRFPYYSLVIYDAVRPFHIQKMMWDSLKMPGGVKQQYLSAPDQGSLHNYGVAVDVGLVSDDGQELDMGTKFDYFGELAHTNTEDKLMEEGKLTHRQLLNRLLLRSVMSEAGITPIETEWWHFNACSRTDAANRFKMIE